MFVPSLSAIASERMYTYCSVGPWSGASSINLDNYREALEHDKHTIVIDEPYDIRHHIASWRITVVSETTISEYSEGYLPGAISNESTTAYNLKKPKVAQPLTRSNHEEGYVGLERLPLRRMDNCIYTFPPLQSPYVNDTR